MIELNRLLYKQLRLSRHEDKIQVYPSDVASPLVPYIREYKETLLEQIDYRDNYIHQGVGYHLSNLIPSFLATKECGCVKDAKRYDELGPLWCERNKEEIINKLNRKAKKSLLGKLSGPLSRRYLSLQVEKALLLSQKEFAPSPGNLFVGITTAPRKEPTLLDTLFSLEAVGFPSPIIYAEPESLTTTFPTVQHKEKLGAWRNWVYMVRHALSFPSSYFLFLQDDVVFHHDTFSFVEKNLEGINGFLSLYTPKKYSQKQSSGVRRVYTKSLWGACALLFPRKTLERVAEHPVMDNWLGARARRNPTSVYQKRRENPSMIANVDTAVGKIMNRLSLPMNFVIPSPCKHVAQHSTLNHGGNIGPRNCNPCSNIDLPLSQQVERIDFTYARKVSSLSISYPPIDAEFVTSLSPKRDLSHQLYCLSTWKKLGARVTILQPREEIPQFGSRLSSFNVVPTDNLLITNFTRYCNTLGKPVILINSDIEVYYRQKDFIKHWVDVPPQTLQIGKRWENNWRQVWGTDAFRLLPEVEFPEMGLELGICVWDMALPYYYISKGYKLRTDPDPTLIHKSHKERRWTKAHSDPFFKRVEEKLGVSQDAIRKRLMLETEGSYIRFPLNIIGEPIHFQHIPKCAGTTIKALLRRDTDSFGEYTYGEIGNELVVSSHTYISGRKSILLLRDPIERVVSLYHHIRKTKNHPLYSALSQVSLEEAPDVSDEFRNYMSRYVAPLSSYSLIGTTDKMDEFLYSMRDLLKIREPYPTTYLNVGKYPSPPERTLARLREVNKEDIKLWQSLQEQQLTSV